MFSLWIRIIYPAVPAIQHHMQQSWTSTALALHLFQVTLLYQQQLSCHHHPAFQPHSPHLYRQFPCRLEEKKETGLSPFLGTPGRNLFISLPRHTRQEPVYSSFFLLQEGTGKLTNSYAHQVGTGILPNSHAHQVYLPIPMHTRQEPVY